MRTGRAPSYRWTSHLLEFGESLTSRAEFAACLGLRPDDELADDDLTAGHVDRRG